MRKVNLQIENGIITGYTEIPLDETQKVYEFTDEQLDFIDTHIGLINEQLEIVEDLKAKRELEKLRAMREPLLVAFDKYKSNVNYGVQFESEEDRNVIISWYRDLLNLEKSAFENIPERIKYYL